ncbi:hypothetical protein BDQ12DRAFT_731370 [Crucibulum laeve]|uniref:Uncharacterized protein n=1 Tax=Crucibulum laeve TaxID=68775 RepID=A0A5C3MHC1_9AGAR|nr:hypothetical protein BDQ12DRAFT_731370 [Crucibulum laeve]
MSSVSQTDNTDSPSEPPVAQGSALQPKSTKKGRHLSSMHAPAASKPNVSPSVLQNKISRRSSKPIINWFQRKLAGTVKAKRVENLPMTIADLGKGRGRTGQSRVTGRVASSPLPSPLFNGKPQSRLDPNLARRKTISLNGDEDTRQLSRSFGEDDTSLGRSSFARESLWSPASALEADEDASVRPIPPTAPPSPSPSRSSSSYVSDPRTFRSMAASTKPTTILSVDMEAMGYVGGVAHIAQAPVTSPRGHRNAPHIRHSSSVSNSGLLGSGGSITFSALPQSSSRPASLRMNSLGAGSQHITMNGNGPFTSVQAPLHTSHHPRNNPRPSSPPLDNASVLTLASSAFGIPGRNPTTGVSSIRGGGDSISHFGESTYADAESASQLVVGDDDIDASVRALRPRSSRGSWGSVASEWSSKFQTGTPSVARERSTYSVRTGRLSTENGETYERSEREVNDGDDGGIEGEKKSEADPSISTASPFADPELPPQSPSVELQKHSQEESAIADQSRPSQQHLSATKVASSSDSKNDKISTPSLVEKTAELSVTENRECEASEKSI